MIHVEFTRGELQRCNMGVFCDGESILARDRNVDICKSQYYIL